MPTLTANIILVPDEGHGQRRVDRLDQEVGGGVARFGFSGRVHPSRTHRAR